jgi:hypothetical protein
MIDCLHEKRLLPSEHAEANTTNHSAIFIEWILENRVLCWCRYCDPNRPVLTDLKRYDLLRVVTSVESGIVCGPSALDLHDLTDEIPREQWRASPKEMKKPQIPGVRFVRTSHLAPVHTRLKLEDHEVLVFDKVRSVVDTFSTSESGGRYQIAATPCQAGYSQFPTADSYARTLRVNIENYLLAVSA